jgi:hypothetical protein
VPVTRPTHTLAAIALLWLGACTGDTGTVRRAGTGKSTDTAGDSATDNVESGAHDSADTSRDSADTSGDTSGETADTAPPAPVACTAYGTPVQMGAVVDATLTELSGIAVSRRDPDLLWVMEDHLGAPAVYGLDTTGALRVTVNLTDATNNDWEDIALAPCGEETCLYVGEIGNNASDRVGLGVYRFPEPDPDDAVDGVIDTTWDFFGFVYPDTNQNAEALAVTSAGIPVVFTKRYDDETSNVYGFPSMDPGTEVPLTALGTFSSGAVDANAAAAVTAADLWPDDSRLIVRTYGGMFEFDTSGGLETLNGAIKTDVVGAVETGGEAIAYDPVRRGFWQVSEGVASEIWFTGCAEGE